MEEINFRNPIFFGFGFPSAGLLISGGLPKGTFWECTLSIVTIGFSIGCAQDNGNSNTRNLTQ